MIQPSFSSSPGGAAVFDTTLIERSAWFDGAADYLEYTPASGSGNSDWTFSAWVRRLAFGSYGGIFSARVNVNNLIQFYFSSDDKIRITVITAGTTQADATTVMVFRDTSWYHLALQYDGTNSLLTLWVNGESVLTDAITSTAAAAGQSASAHDLGVIRNGAGSLIYFGNLVMAQSTLILGSAPAASTFLTSYTFGANGSQYVPRADAAIAALATAAGGNSFCLTTAIGDGTDASGNGNNFTPTSMSDAANGTADTPSDSYALLNPLDTRATTYTTIGLANGNLELTYKVGNAARSAFGDTLGGGQWVFEVTMLATGASWIGWSALNVDLNNIVTQGPAVVYRGDNGNKYVSSTSGTGAPTSSAYGATYVSGDVIRVEADFTASTVEFFKNGTSQGSIGISGMNDGTVDYFPSVYGSNASLRVNFGQQPFIGTPTAGFKALSTANRPTPDYQGIDYFNPILYTGNGSTNAITGVGFQPAFTWIKNRVAADQHVLTDAVRGATKYLSSDGTDIEVTATETLASFDADGFTVGSDVQVNTNTEAYAAWCWAANTASPADGTIDLTGCRVSPAGFFSVATWTGTGVAGTVAHGLAVPPEVVIVKNMTDAVNWTVGSDYLSAGAWDYYIILDTNVVQQGPTGVVWNGVPTSTFWQPGTDNVTNGSGDSMVAYCFAPVRGVCAIGSYVGTASATTGPYVRCGFRPRWMLIKGLTTNTSWVLIDTERRPFNNDTDLSALYADLTAIETTASNDEVDLLADGFKPRGSGSECNQSGQTFLYIAIADIAGGGDLPPIYGR